VAGALGLRGAKLLLYVLLAAAYLLVIAGILNGTFVRGSALALFSAPLGWTLIKQVAAAQAPSDLVMLDVAAARVHMLFGLLLVIGVMLPIG
jgi:1,4-dihydroxy-2-naphthoate octaprenyltransferase